MPLSTYLGGGELATHYFLEDCFGGSSNLVGTGITLFSARLFWRQLKFGGSWLHIIFQQIVLEAAQIWRELAPHYFSTDCFGGSSNLEGTGSTLFSGGLFWKFGRNWLHIIFRRIVLEALRFGRNWLHIIFRRIVLKILIYKFINWWHSRTPIRCLPGNESLYFNIT